MAVANKSSTARPQRKAQPKTRNGDKKMNGLINSSKLSGIGTFGALAVAFYSVSVVLYMLTGSGPA